MYAVMRLNTSVEVTDIFKVKHLVNLENNNRMGYISVYKTKKRSYETYRER